MFMHILLSAVLLLTCATAEITFPGADRNLTFGRIKHLKGCLQLRLKQCEYCYEANLVALSKCKFSMSVRFLGQAGRNISPLETEYLATCQWFTDNPSLEHQCPLYESVLTNESRGVEKGNCKDEERFKDAAENRFIIAGNVREVAQKAFSFACTALSDALRSGEFIPIGLARIGKASTRGALNIAKDAVRAAKTRLDSACDDLDKCRNP